MSNWYRYVLVDRDGTEEDYEYESYAKALTAAEHRGGEVAVSERQYEYRDTGLVWTPNGSNTWPPEPGTEEQEEEA